MRGEKHAESAKPQTEISIEHLHLLYKDATHSARATTKIGRKE